MKFLRIRSWLLLSLLLPVLGCSKPESSLVGKWASEKTATVMEFNSDKTGVIHPRSGTNLPPSIDFKWTMEGADQFRVEMTLPGAAAAPTGVGRLVEKDSMIFEDDPFRKMK